MKGCARFWECRTEDVINSACKNQGGNEKNFKKKKNGRFYREDGIWAGTQGISSCICWFIYFLDTEREWHSWWRICQGREGPHRKLQTVLWERGGSGKRWDKNPSPGRQRVLLSAVLRTWIYSVRIPRRSSVQWATSSESPYLVSFDTKVLTISRKAEVEYGEN